MSAVPALLLIAAVAPAPPPPPTAGGGARSNVPPALFALVDVDKDGFVAKAEWTAAFEGWFSDGDSALSEAALVETLAPAWPSPPPRARPPQNQTPEPKDVEAMRAALPTQAPAVPKRPRRVLVLGTAAGFVHSSIPLAARTVEEMGKKTKAWSTTITYDPADINAANLKAYDGVFLASTTGAFLDDPDDTAATEARKKALLEFVRGGKGLIGIHAATDTYHRSPVGGAGGAARAAATVLVTEIVAQGDRSGDQRVSREEMRALAEAWHAALDPERAGKVGRDDFVQRFAARLPAPTREPLGPTGFPVQRPATPLGPDTRVGTWPEFNRMIGAFFKFHWNDGQVVTVKVEEPDHPLNAPFKGQPALQVMDETYTFARDTYSRANLRVLTSVDYSTMSAEDKAKEQNPRSDGDYPLSWIRREGAGRVFYEAHGHSERVYAIPLVLAHVLHGIQYALGDLPADDRPRPPSGP